jgi:hypothetical protein
MACYSAAGVYIPPMFIFIGQKQVGQNILEGAPADSVVGVSESGWMVEELFYKWLIFFSQSIPRKRPAVLIVDNHESRFSLRIIKLAQSEDIRLVLLPPNATHLMQVGDVAVHAPFKKFVRTEAHSFMIKSRADSVTKYNYCQVIGPAFRQAFTPNNIAAGYQATGIYPFCPAKVIIHLKAVKLDIVKTIQVQQQINLPAIQKILTTPGELKVRSHSDMTPLRK